MKHHTRSRHGRQPRQEFVLVEVVGNRKIDEVLKPIAGRKVVDHNDVAFTLHVECAHQVRPDKARTASHQNHSILRTITTGQARLQTARRAILQRSPAYQPQYRPRGSPG